MLDALLATIEDFNDIEPQVSSALEEFYELSNDHDIRRRLLWRVFSTWQALCKFGTKSAAATFRRNHYDEINSYYRIWNNGVTANE